MSPLGDDFAVDLFLAEVVSLDHHNDFVADGERGVVIVERIGAHDHHAVGKVAENAAGVLARDLRLPPGPLGVAQFRAVKGIGIGLFDGDDQFSTLPIILLHDAVQGVAPMVLLPQVGDSGIAHLPLVRSMSYPPHSTRQRRGPTASTWHLTRAPLRFMDGWVEK